LQKLINTLLKVFLEFNVTRVKISNDGWRQICTLTNNLHICVVRQCFLHTESLPEWRTMSRSRQHDHLRLSYRNFWRKMQLFQ